MESAAFTRYNTAGASDEETHNILNHPARRPGSKNEKVDEIINVQEEMLGQLMKDLSVDTEDIDLGTITLESTTPQ